MSNCTLPTLFGSAEAHLIGKRHVQIVSRFTRRCTFVILLEHLYPLRFTRIDMMRLLKPPYKVRVFYRSADEPRVIRQICMRTSSLWGSCAIYKGRIVYSCYTLLPYLIHSKTCNYLGRSYIKIGNKPKFKQIMIMIMIPCVNPHQKSQKSPTKPN